MNVPFLNLYAQHAPLREEIHAAVQEVIESSAFAGGPFVTKFEEDFSAFCQTKHAIGVGSGTEAIWLTLLALGIGPGDEVITVPNTFIATAEAISFCGAKPVFVDVDEQTYTIDPAKLDAAVTPNTRAIIPVHLFGQMADMDPILKFAKSNGLYVVEDACQAHGAEYKGRRAGSIGDAGCFSFYPGKNLGAFGEAGAVVTNNEDLKEKIQMLRDHGQARKYHHTFIGWNGRMDGIQAAILRIKLKRLTEGNTHRRAFARIYNRLLEDVSGLITPAEASYATHVYHLYVIRTGHRDDLQRKLAERGIACGIHYPVPLHLQEAYRPLGVKEGSLPVAERTAREFLSLPLFPEMTIDQVTRVATEIKSSLATTKVGRSVPAEPLSSHPQPLASSAAEGQGKVANQSISQPNQKPISQPLYSTSSLFS